HQDVVLVAGVRVVRVRRLPGRPVRAEDVVHVVALDPALQRLVGERGPGPGEREHAHERNQQAAHQRVVTTCGRVPRPPVGSSVRGSHRNDRRRELRRTGGYLASIPGRLCGGARLRSHGEGSGSGKSTRRYWDRLSWRYQLARIVSPSSSAASASRLLARPARPQAPDCRAGRSASRPCTVARDGAPASNAALAVEPSASAISGGRRCWCPSRTARRYHWFASVWPASRSAHARSTITTPCRATALLCCARRNDSRAEPIASSGRCCSLATMLCARHHMPVSSGSLAALGARPVSSSACAPSASFMCVSTIARTIRSRSEAWPPG